LKNGRSFFLGVEVASDFYDGPGSRWLARYHGVVAALYVTMFGALAAILALDEWNWIPAWAGGTAVYFTATMMGFSAWARHRLASPAPVLRAALSLEPRRLSSYISWPVELLCFAAVGCSWWMLLQQAGPISLQGPLSLTWAILGLFPGKITIVRQGWPIPAERAAEHRTAQEASRRHSIRQMDACGLMASILFMTALRSAWPAARTLPAAQWLLVGIPLAFGLILVLVIAQQNRIIQMSRTLRPAGSWNPPFGRAASMSRTGLVWFAIWFGGLMLLTFLPIS
jgi:hypothetical protein